MHNDRCIALILIKGEHGFKTSDIHLSISVSASNLDVCTLNSGSCFQTNVYPGFYFDLRPISICGTSLTCNLIMQSKTRLVL